MEFSYHQDYYAANNGCFVEVEGYHHQHYQHQHQISQQPNQFVCYESQQFDQKLSHSQFETYHHQQPQYSSIASSSSSSPDSNHYYQDGYYSYPSSIESQSPPSGDSSPFGQIDNNLDSILDEIAANAENIDDILLAKNEDDLYNLLETSDHYSPLSSSSLDFDDNQSVVTLNSETTTSCSPQRKLSIDSSSGYCSFDCDSIETSSSSSLSPSPPSTTNQSNAAATDTNRVKRRRNRRCKHTKEERALRKKDQNKKAAIKYRERKKVQTETIEQIIEQLEYRRDELTIQFSRIETEFNVILPLARQAFQVDPIRGQQLQQLIQRLQQNGFNQ
uniref:Uncharacterized protein LOC113792625 n=1 Tax=Dermatophagoides pteronyssinus TaxID=6956 RepID=A0A6P6XYF8_DERPT|nr:uncharacterized protein LOC113792625 [Dermatophagoides pteronyssinus]